MAKKEGKEESGLAIISGKTPTLEALALVDEQIRKIKSIEENPKTNGQLENGLGSTLDINKEEKIDVLIRALASVRERERSYNEAAEALGLKTIPAFTVGGGNADAWTHDIKKRIEVITQKTKLEKLTKWRDGMSKFLTEQEQKDRFLKDMQDDLAELI